MWRQTLGQGNDVVASYALVQRASTILYLSLLVLRATSHTVHTFTVFVPMFLTFLLSACIVKSRLAKQCGRAMARRLEMIVFVVYWICSSVSGNSEEGLTAAAAVGMKLLHMEIKNKTKSHISTTLSYLPSANIAAAPTRCHPNHTKVLQYFTSYQP